MENEHTHENPNSLSAVVSAFEEKYALLKTEDGQIIKWPQKKLPDNFEKGTELQLIIKTAENDSAEREAMAKEILNQILKRE